MCFLSPIPMKNFGAIHHRKATPQITASGAIMLKLGKFEKLIADLCEMVLIYQLKICKSKNWICYDYLIVRFTSNSYL